MQKLLPAVAMALTLAFCGMAYADDDGHEGWEGHPHCEKALSKLPADKREMFRATMEQAHEDNKAAMEQAHKLHEELHAIVTAPQFDKAKFLAKTDELQKLHEKIHQSMTEALASAYSQLSQDQRKIVAEEMHHHGHMHKHHEHHKPQPANDKQDATDSKGGDSPSN